MSRQSRWGPRSSSTTCKAVCTSCPLYTCLWEKECGAVPCFLRLSPLLKRAGVWLCEGFGSLLASFFFFLWIIFSPLVGSSCLNGASVGGLCKMHQSSCLGVSVPVCAESKIKAHCEREGELHHYLWVDPLSSVWIWETPVIQVTSVFGWPLPSLRSRHCGSYGWGRFPPHGGLCPPSS